MRCSSKLIYGLCSSSFYTSSRISCVHSTEETHLGRRERREEIEACLSLENDLRSAGKEHACFQEEKPRQRMDKKIKSPPQKITAQELAREIRYGHEPSDTIFDRFLSPHVRFASYHFWTSAAVAMRISEWLVKEQVQRVLDVGSGPGKFCVIGALATQCSFVGIEQRENLVLYARQLAKCFEVEARVQFIHGVFGEEMLEDFDAYYFYNPFGENTFSSNDWLDNSVELSEARYLRDVLFTEDMMRRAPLGTYFIFYNGFGGTMPHTYDELYNDTEAPNPLQMWKKTRAL
jgi:SAM-dependent methyltransferase